MKCKLRCIAKCLQLLLMTCWLVQSSYAEPQYWPDYERGNTTAPVAIQALQYLLVARGYPMKVDGRFGKETQSAVRKFQSSQRLKPTGVMTAGTWEKLIVKLKRGSRGSAVRSLQLQLNLIGYKTKPTAVFDQQTETQVRAFQKRHDLEVDGIVGRRTWSRLAMEMALYYE